MPAAKPPEFRRRAVDSLARDQPVAKIAAHREISPSCLGPWMAALNVDAGRRAGLSSPAREERVELRRSTRVQAIEILKHLGVRRPGERSPTPLTPVVLELAADGLLVTVTCTVLWARGQHVGRKRIARVMRTAGSSGSATAANAVGTATAVLTG